MRTELVTPSNPRRRIRRFAPKGDQKAPRLTARSLGRRASVKRRGHWAGRPLGSLSPSPTRRRRRRGPSYRGDVQRSGQTDVMPPGARRLARARSTSSQAGTRRCRESCDRVEPSCGFSPMPTLAAFLNCSRAGRPRRPPMARSVKSKSCDDGPNRREVRPRMKDRPLPVRCYGEGGGAPCSPDGTIVLLGRSVNVKSMARKSCR